jgi:hypothetical protein
VYGELSLSRWSAFTIPTYSGLCFWRWQDLAWCNGHGVLEAMGWMTRRFENCVCLFSDLAWRLGAKSSSLVAYMHSVKSSQIVLA